MTKRYLIRKIFLFFLLITGAGGIMTAQEYKVPPRPDYVDPWKYTEATVKILEEAPVGSADRIGEIVEAVITEKYTGSDPFYRRMSYPALKLRVIGRASENEENFKCEVIGIYPAHLADPMYRQSTELRDCPNMNYDEQRISTYFGGYIGPIYGRSEYKKLFNRVDQENTIYYYVAEIAEDCEFDDFYKKNLTGIHLWTTQKISAKPFQEINRHIGDGGLGDDGEPFFRISFGCLTEIPDSTFINIPALREIYPVSTISWPSLPKFGDNSFHPSVYLFTAVIYNRVKWWPEYDGYMQTFEIQDKKWLRFLNNRTYGEVDMSWTQVEDVSVDSTEPCFKIENSSIHISDLRPGSVVNIYDLSSRRIHTALADGSGACSLYIDNPGFYIVKADRFAKKFLINSN